MNVLEESSTERFVSDSTIGIRETDELFFLRLCDNSDLQGLR
jgi:hypothetical protein